MFYFWTNLFFFIFGLIAIKIFAIAPWIGRLGMALVVFLTLQGGRPSTTPPKIDPPAVTSDLDPTVGSSDLNKRNVSIKTIWVRKSPGTPVTLSDRWNDKPYGPIEIIFPNGTHETDAPGQKNNWQGTSGAFLFVLNDSVKQDSIRVDLTLWSGSK